MSASGTIAKTLTASKWKGVKIMKAYSKSARGPTPKQEAQQAALAAAAAFWALPDPNTQQKFAWMLHQETYRTKMTAYNLHIRAAMNLYKHDPVHSNMFTHAVDNVDRVTFHTAPCAYSESTLLPGLYKIRYDTHRRSLGHWENGILDGDTGELTGSANLFGHYCQLYSPTRHAMSGLIDLTDWES